LPTVRGGEPMRDPLHNSSLVQRVTSTLQMSGRFWAGNDSDSESDSDSDSESDNEPAREQVNTVSREEERRLREAAIQNFRTQRAHFAQDIDGHRLIGFHETKSENVEGLVENGPAVELIDSGNGVGKGPGFYVTPISRVPLLDLPYGDAFVLVYIDPGLTPIILEEDDRVPSDSSAELDNENSYYVTNGGGEIIIPQWCFDKIKIIAQ